MGGTTGAGRTRAMAGRIGLPVTTAPRSAVPGNVTAGRAPRRTAMRFARPGWASASWIIRGTRHAVAASRAGNDA